eukprot:scaffold21901_cov59-Cyclotella_meneghiniana.AAC.3
MGSEYLNTFNCALSEVFNCNTNVQIGDVWQVYYSTLCGSNSTQKEDSDGIYPSWRKIFYWDEDPTRLDQRTLLQKPYVYYYLDCGQQPQGMLSVLQWPIY